MRAKGGQPWRWGFAANPESREGGWHHSPAARSCSYHCSPRAWLAPAQGEAPCSAPSQAPSAPPGAQKRTKKRLTASPRGWTPGWRAGRGLAWAGVGQNQPAKRCTDTGEARHKQTASQPRPGQMQGHSVAPFSLATRQPIFIFPQQKGEISEKDQHWTHSPSPSPWGQEQSHRAQHASCRNPH